MAIGGFNDVLSVGDEKDEFSFGDGSEVLMQFLNLTAVILLSHMNQVTPEKESEKGLNPSIRNSSTENHNMASNFPSELSNSSSCWRGGCGSNNIDDDGSNANKQGRPAKPTAAQTGQKDRRREREREVKTYMTGYTTNQSAIKVNLSICLRLN